MFEERHIQVEDAVELLRQCGLSLSKQKPQVTVGIYDSLTEKLIATGSLVGDMLQMLAVSPEYRGEDLLAKVVTHLLGAAYDRGISRLYLFTKFDNRAFFRELGFSSVAEVPGKAALMEWGKSGIDEYCAQLKKEFGECSGRAGALVMNCNPFTLGHLYLIERAASFCSRVIVLAVEEDWSVFPFSVRFDLIKRGTRHLPNVSVFPGGRYVISSLTFPSYFTKESDLADVQASMDAEIFRRCLAPSLGITDRFMGTEPYSAVTALYNQAVARILEPAGICVHLLERLQIGGQAVSASRVRALLAGGQLQEVRELVPESTWDFLTSGAFEPVKARLAEEAARTAGCGQ